MDLLKNFSVPFINRDQLNFAAGQAFSVRITSQANTAATLTIRGMTKDGSFTFSHSTTNDGTLQNTTFRLPDIPIFISCIDSNSSFKTGDVYANLTLLVNGDRLYELCSGYVYNQKSISYPNNNSNDSMPGRGRIRMLNGGLPGAGNDLTDQVPVGRIWRVLAVNMRLVASATVSNRRVRLQFADSVTSFNIFLWSNTDQTASQTIDYRCTQLGSVQSETFSGSIVINIPDNIYLPEGAQILTNVVNLQADDNFTIFSYLIEEFFVTPT